MDNASWLFDIVEHDRSYRRGDSGSWYGYEDAVRDAISSETWPQELKDQHKDHPYQLLLYRHGCITESGLDCATACLDPSTAPKAMWATNYLAYTLHNCMVLPWILALLASDRLTAAAIDVAAKYNISNDTSLDMASSWPLINSCTVGYCHASDTMQDDLTQQCTINSDMTKTADYKLPDSRFDDEFWTLVRLTVRRCQEATLWSTDIQLFKKINTTLCDGLGAAVNADIAGIGVSFLSTPRRQ